MKILERSLGLFSVYLLLTASPIPIACLPAQAAEVQVTFTKPKVSGDLDSATVSRGVQRKLGAIKTCYTAQSQLSPRPGEFISVSFTVGPNGRVSSAEATRDTLANKKVGPCVLAEIRTWTFPKALGGKGRTKVELTFTFKRVD